MINDFDQVSSTLIQAVIPEVMTDKEGIFSVQLSFHSVLTETIMNIDIHIFSKP